MYRIQAVKKIAGRLRLLIAMANTTEEAFALIASLREEGWECRPKKIETS